MILDEYIIFFTSTIVGWKHLLKPDKYKQLIVGSLKFMNDNNRIWLYAFVIMPNHVHLIMRVKDPYTLSFFQRDFLKFTSQKIIYDLKDNHIRVLELFRSNKKDRTYQLWQDKAFSKPLYNRKVIEQKIEYIHNNPLSKSWNLAEKPEDYRFSSASFYLDGIDDFGFITHFGEHV